MTLGTMNKESARCASGEIAHGANGRLTVMTLGTAWIAAAMKYLVTQIGSMVNTYDHRPHRRVHLCASKPNMRYCDRASNHLVVAVNDNGSLLRCQCAAVHQRHPHPQPGCAIRRISRRTWRRR
jgi:hypothetical protein